MKIQTIKAIFTSTLFVIGVIITVIGFVNSTRTLVNLVVFDKYPLGYEESRCQEGYPPRTSPTETDQSRDVSSEELKQQNKQDCLEQLDQERKQRLVNDITNSTSLLLSGIVISLLFRRFIFN